MRHTAALRRSTRVAHASAQALACILRRSYRSSEWFGKHDKDGFIHRSWMKNHGLPHHVFDGRPVIGICNSWSELTPCNAHFRHLAEAVKRGVWEAGGFPVEFPTMSLGESVMKPTTMLFRNLMSMDVEESIRANPIDGVVLLAGCDKTTPAMLMGAASADLPTILLSGGPMLNGKFCGKDIGSGTDVWKFSDDVRTGAMSLQSFIDAEACMSRSHGHCNTMGTASTMACMAESLGMTLPSNAAIPGADARRYTLAHLTGSRIVQMVKDDLKMSKVLSRKSFENAIRVNAAIGGSTNFVVHLLALAGRAGIPLTLDDFQKFGKEMPLLVNLRPSGEYLMEDFYYAGGLPAVLRELKDIIHTDALTINGKTIGENAHEAPCYNRKVITTMQEPVKHHAGITVLRGNLAKNGALIKVSAATPALLKHKGKAVVFETIEDFKKRVDDPSLEVDETCVLVLKNAGPKGYPGFPEVGNLPLPKKILDKGITDMVRISDARMSGTAFGTVILHSSPEAAAGGVLAVVKTGDMIELDVEAQKIHLCVSEEEIAERLRNWKPIPIPAHYQRGYAKLYMDHVMQSHEGADLDFLVGKSGTFPLRESH
eukprot:Phypoly_transcript_05075.p1 GENE.Phypoly_transcript_05075~~Phypoly_transcript_05075.p1  ORF type:complete len:598 (+),score=76.88 Phypoly_transcript_05075:134-1927(+)